MRVVMSKRHQGFTRRDFVGAAAATAALPLIVPAAALGDTKNAAASDRLTLGFIGVGTQARYHLGHFLGTSDVQVLAVCDVDTHRAESAKKVVEDRYGQKTRSGRYRGCAACNDFRELLAR
jgi:ornithine cyclodeaminase/alanine dehydrogenase-like protein (mu-crystallin family)